MVIRALYILQEVIACPDRYPHLHINGIKSGRELIVDQELLVQILGVKRQSVDLFQLIEQLRLHQRMRFTAKKLPVDRLSIPALN